MAKARIGGKTGSVAWTSGGGIDFASWDVDASQGVEDDTSYTDTNPGASHSGNGSVVYEVSAAGFVYKGTTPAPGIGVASGATIVGDVDGSSITLTADTSCTYTGTAICASARLSHAKKSAAATASYRALIDGDLTEARVTE